MTKPASLLSAARHVAEISGMPWSEVQPYYRALQESGGKYASPWLPKSQGRNIWAAHPFYIARLLFALGGARLPAEAHGVVEVIREMTPSGRNKFAGEGDAAGELAPLERIFHLYLTDETAAQDVISVEFKLDRNEVVINTNSAGEEVYSLPSKYRDGSDVKPRPFRGIYSRGIIQGMVFVFMSKTTAWRLDSQVPFEAAKPGDELDD